MHPAIEVVKLKRLFRKKQARRSWRTVVALEEIDLEIQEGELFGVLGPNGAGKTTLIKILATLLLPTSGQAFVDGIDVVKDPRAVRRRINMVSGGEHSGYGILTVRETLWMFSQFYGVPGKVARERINELLRVVGLEEEANTRISRLSTGMRQKMNFARGFVSDPKIVFLDEPTLGLDVGAARDARNFIKSWVKDRPGKTVLLTTHYMTEAEELCDRVAIIDRGKILACDTPENLKRRVKKDSIFHLEVAGLDSWEGLHEIAGVKQLVSTPRDGFTELKFILDHEDVLPQLLGKITERGSRVLYMRKTEPTLEDVFIELVGRSLEVDTAER
ncbi:MAG: ABC transporter ATP-binding protein [Candidatus Acetothermia bacterium]|nr:ABC transporter ATP-binding protein [Candidatus Acetothermia bacterium]MDH7504998.1 ABC transporter ATP-binding protein [Candidatus Acetothermia bacterium]